MYGVREDRSAAGMGDAHQLLHYLRGGSNFGPAHGGVHWFCQSVINLLCCLGFGERLGPQRSRQVAVGLAAPPRVPHPSRHRVKMIAPFHGFFLSSRPARAKVPATRCTANCEARRISHLDPSRVRPRSGMARRCASRQCPRRRACRRGSNANAPSSARCSLYPDWPGRASGKFLNVIWGRKSAPAAPRLSGSAAGRIAKTCAPICPLSYRSVTLQNRCDIGVSRSCIIEREDKSWRSHSK